MRSLMKHPIVLMAVASFMALATTAEGDSKSVSINRQFATTVTVEPESTTPAKSLSTSTLTLERVKKASSESVEIKRTRRSLVQWLRGDSVATPEHKPEQALQGATVLRPANKPSSSRFSTQRVWKAKRP